MNTNYHFPVSKQQIFLSDGTEIKNRVAIVRDDTKETLGIASPGYKIIEHSKVVDMFSSVETLKPPVISVCNRGAILVSKYDFRDGVKLSTAVIKKGDVVNFGLRVFNSYNQQTGVGFEVYGMRLVCLNGLTIPASLAHLSYRHFEKTEVKKLGETIMARLESARDVIQLWKEWAQTRIPAERVDGFFDGLDQQLGKKAVETLKASVNESVLKPGSTMWDLFNIFTFHTTHNNHPRILENSALSQINKEDILLNRFYRYNWK